MSAWLRQSTTVTVRLGPFLDVTDAFTPETNVSTAITVSKNHGAFGARSSATAIAHDANGWYSVELNTTDTGTAGPLIIQATDIAVHGPVWREFMVLPANVWDALVAGGANYLPADVKDMHPDIAALIADTTMTRASSNWEATAPAKSLGTAVMKSVHKTEDAAGTLNIYRSNGSTIHASQTITTDENNAPIDGLTGAS